jgi:hypothetical protein
MGANRIIGDALKMSEEYLVLKWGTVKAIKMKSDKAKELYKRWADIGYSLSAMTHHDTDEQKQILCDLIDTLDCETIHLDWDGEDVSKEHAKKYSLEYGKK